MSAGVINQQNRVAAQGRRRLSTAAALSLVAHIALAGWAAVFTASPDQRQKTSDLDLTFISLQAPARQAAASAEPEPTLEPASLTEPEDVVEEPPAPIVKKAPVVRAKTRPRPAPAPSPKTAPAPTPKAPPPQVAQGDALPGPDAVRERKPGPSDAHARNLLAAYQAQVARRIHSVKRYPFEARRNREEGKVRVRFVITGGGGVEALEVIASSGYSSLDQAALDAINRAAPFPPLPAETGLSELVIVAPITFSLDFR